MDCTCRTCGGLDELGYGYEVITKPEEPKEVQTQPLSIYEKLEYLASQETDSEKRKSIENMMREVDFLDEQLNKIQKRLARQGSGFEARELGEVSQKLF